MGNKLIGYTLAATLAMAASTAWADLAVVVSAKTGVGDMERQQVAEVFLGKVSTFPDGRAAIPLEQSEGGVAQEFHSKVIGKTESQLKAYWSKLVFSGKGTPPKELSGSAEVRKVVADNPNTIGYIDKSMVDGSVRLVLTVK